jgi:peptidoglycan/xylan/chitin deacetylase (PgdA/CDA1 family)
MAAREARQMDVEAHRARREAQRRAVVRRRRLAAGSILVGLAVAALAIVVVTSRSGSPATSTAQSAARIASARRLGAHARPSHTGPPRDGAPAAAGTGRPGTAAVPILMYHVINAPPAGAPFPGLYVEPQQFAEQMQALKDAGWHAVTLDQVEAYWREGVALGPGKPIVLSFDNGYQSQYAHAFPVLRRLGWVGDENIQLTGLPPSQGGLGEDEVRELIDDGWELDTQGISHADLITLDSEQLTYQVADARHILQQRYHVPVNWFCYPSGHYDAAVIAAVKAAGFVGSTTVVPGWAHHTDDPYRLHRLRVLGGTSAQQLLSLVEGTRENGPAPASYNGTEGAS